MAGNKHATAFSMDNDATAAFATGRKPNPLELLTKTLGQATSRPDVRPGEQGRSALILAATEAEEPKTEQVIEPVAAAESAVIATPEPAAPAPAPAPAPLTAFSQNEIKHQNEMQDDGASYSIPQASRDEVNRGGRPRHGAERKVERTISMDKSMDKILLNLAIIESVRLGRRVSSAEIAVHLMQFGLANMKDNQILPGEDGLGLELPTQPPVSVSLPKLGANAR